MAATRRRVARSASFRRRSSSCRRIFRQTAPRISWDETSNPSWSSSRTSPVQTTEVPRMTSAVPAVQSGADRSIHIPAVSWPGFPSRPTVMSAIHLPLTRMIPCILFSFPCPFRGVDLIGRIAIPGSAANPAGSGVRLKFSHPKIFSCQKFLTKLLA